MSKVRDAGGWRLEADTDTDAAGWSVVWLEFLFFLCDGFAQSRHTISPHPHLIHCTPRQHLSPSQRTTYLLIQTTLVPWLSVLFVHPENPSLLIKQTCIPNDTPKTKVK